MGVGGKGRLQDEKPVCQAEDCDLQIQGHQMEFLEGWTWEVVWSALHFRPWRAPSERQLEAGATLRGPEGSWAEAVGVGAGPREAFL